MKPTHASLLVLLAACAPGAAPDAAPAGGDTTFAGVQARGRVAMGVDQYTSAHRFDSLADGGRIELQRDTADAAGVAEIRSHLRTIRDAFARGDFRVPGFVHNRDVPGTDVMARLSRDITYSYADLPGGGEVRIRTANPEAVEAVHHFMAFQRGDHRAPGHEHGAE